MTIQVIPSKRAQAEAVVARALKAHAAERVPGMDVWRCICDAPGNLDRLKQDQILKHQAWAVMFALNAWVTA